MKCRHVLLISDSCFSGSLLARADSYLDDTIVADALESRKSRWIITSGGRDETVQDGSGSNSPFAEAILSELRHNHQPKLLTDKLALRIRDITRANAPQMSQAEKLYEAGDLGGRFVFNLRDREADDWQSALSENSVPGFQAFKNRYPGSSHIAKAQECIVALNEQAAWETACKTNISWTYADFIKNYPQSTFVSEALLKIAELEDLEDWKRAKVTRTLSAYLKYKIQHPTGKFWEAANTEIVKLRNQDEAERKTLEEEAERVQAEKQRSDAAKKQEEKDKRQEERRLAKTRQEEAIAKKIIEQRQTEAQVGKVPNQKPQLSQPVPSEPQDDVDNESEQQDAGSLGTTWRKYKISMTVATGSALLLLAIYAIVIKQPTPKPINETANDTVQATKEDDIAAAKGAFRNNQYQIAFEKFNLSKDTPEFDAESAYLFGYMYSQGKGTEKKAAEAVKWFRKAADKGNALAQNELGLMFEKGRGVSKNIDEAKKLYRRAANQGNKDAKNSLNRLETPIAPTPTPPKNDAIEELKEAIATEKEIFTVVEEPPSFPGGTIALYSFLNTNIRYPNAAKRANVSGKVFVSFIVDDDGSIQDVSIMKGLGFGTDEEAVRIVKSMPNWKPGKMSGRAVRVRYNLPINFQLE